MKALRLLPVALVLVLAGAAVLLLATAHLVVGAILAALTVLLLALVIWAHHTVRPTDAPAPYIEHESSLW